MRRLVERDRKFGPPAAARAVRHVQVVPADSNRERAAWAVQVRHGRSLDVGVLRFHAKLHWTAYVPCVVSCCGRPTLFEGRRPRASTPNAWASTGWVTGEHVLG